jgi:hypothetical protein
MFWYRENEIFRIVIIRSVAMPELSGSCFSILRGHGTRRLSIELWTEMRLWDGTEGNLKLEAKSTTYVSTSGACLVDGERKW